MPIKVEGLSYTYGKKSPFEKKALDDVSFTINDGEFVGIVGCTGSGKSTLVQHLNALIRLTDGKIEVDDVDLTKRKPDLQKLRKKIGMLFQYPEYQLFAETVLDDVKFGPKNFGMKDEEATAAAADAIRLVGLDFDEIKDRSPIEISGGQKRRVAVAGVIAYKPDVLILDEPTAGLDPLGKRDMLDLLTRLRNSGAVKTVIMVSHNMDEIAEYADRVIALDQGKVIADGSPEEFFYSSVCPPALTPPHAVSITKKLAENGVVLPCRPLTKKQLISALLDYFGKAKGGENG